MLNDCVTEGLDISEIDEPLLFEEMTTIDTAVTGFQSDDNAELTERDFTNMDAVESDINGKCCHTCKHRSTC